MCEYMCVRVNEFTFAQIMATDKWITDFQTSLGEVLKPASVAPFEALFPCFKSEKKNVFIECISLKRFNEMRINADYFSAKEQTNFTRIVLWEDQWLQSKEIVVSRIRALVGERNRIHARATTVERIDKKTCDAFLNENHLQGATSAYYKYGLMHKGKLVAVATFGKSRVMTDKAAYYRSYEMERYCTLLNHTVTGGLSKLLKYFIETHHAVHLMTYADAAWGKGESYIKLGFTLNGYLPPQTYFVYKNQRYTENRLPSTIPVDDCLKAMNCGAWKFVLEI